MAEALFRIAESKTKAIAGAGSQSAPPTPTRWLMTWEWVCNGHWQHHRLPPPLRRPARAGEILLFRHFTTPDTNAIDQKITVGKRLKVPSINSKTVPGALRVGMFVDLEAAFNTQFGVQVLPVMERVKVIALGTATSYEAASSRVSQSRYSSITIEVTPEQATQMNLIERIMIGDFDLTVRNPSDTTLSKIPSGGISRSVLELVERRRPAVGASDNND